jgi:hypothetical protein
MARRQSRQKAAGMPRSDRDSIAGRQSVLPFGIAQCKIENEKFKIAVQNSKFLRKAQDV